MNTTSEVIDCTVTEGTAKDEPPEDNTTNTDDTSKDDISEVDMSTDSSSKELNSDPKQTGNTWVSHSFEEVVKHLNEVNMNVLRFCTSRPDRIIRPCREP